MKSRLHFLAIAWIALLFVSCSTSKNKSSSLKNFVSGESVVFFGEEPAKLAFAPLRAGTVDVRSTYRDGLTNTIQFEEGLDFIVDAQQGTIRRTAQSRLPDFRSNMLFGIEDFDHSKFPGFGNGKFFTFVDYSAKNKSIWPTQPTQLSFFTKTQAKLLAGEKLKIIAFGDSITAGGEATTPDLIFWQRWADFLQQKYPKAKVEAVNGATGGDTTRNGLDRLSQKVLSQKPDLVLIGFGMNDHNVAGFGVPLDEFGKNLGTIIDRIRKETGAEVVLYSTFPPNPKWHYGSHQMEKYAAATEKVATEKQCAFADVFNNWTYISSKKKPEDLLGNNINHPNDFGHWIYFKVLCGLGL